MPNLYLGRHLHWKVIWILPFHVNAASLLEMTSGSLCRKPGIFCSWISGWWKSLSAAFMCYNGQEWRLCRLSTALVGCSLGKCGLLAEAQESGKWKLQVCSGASFSTIFSEPSSSWPNLPPSAVRGRSNAGAMAGFGHLVPCCLWSCVTLVPLLHEALLCWYCAAWGLWRVEGQRVRTCKNWKNNPSNPQLEPNKTREEWESGGNTSCSWMCWA